MEKTWSNTALVAYSVLPKIVKELDYRLSRLVNSSFKSQHLKNGVSTMQLIGEIMEVNDEKRKIVNLRFIVDSALNQLSEESKKVLLDKIVKRLTYQQIANDLGYSIRTTFRRFEKAQAEYAHHLAVSGFTESWFEQEYGNDKYIDQIRIKLSDDKYFISQNI